MSDLKCCSLALFTSRLCCVTSHDHPDTTRRALNGRVVITCARGCVHSPQSLVLTKCGFKHLHSDCSHVLWNFVLDLENTLVAHTMLGLTGTRVRVPGGSVHVAHEAASIQLNQQRLQRKCRCRKEWATRTVCQNNGLCQEDGSKLQKGLLWEGRKYLLGSRVEQDKIKQEQLHQGSSRAALVRIPSEVKQIVYRTNCRRRAYELPEKKRKVRPHDGQQRS